jgi:hypothetical protein
LFSTKCNFIIGFIIKNLIIIQKIKFKEIILNF